MLILAGMHVKLNISYCFQISVKKGTNNLLFLTKRLIVEGDQLTPSVPEDVRHEISRVDSSAFWEYPAELTPVIFDKFDWVLLQHRDRVGFVERRHFKRASLSCKDKFSSQEQAFILYIPVLQQRFESDLRP